ncbi:MAG: HYR domain-containing protein [Prolixibacteraceae bacterium]|nr:HYR domain-containing protein [Prolixibacteraceae bacterium]
MMRNILQPAQQLLGQRTNTQPRAAKVKRGAEQPNRNSFAFAAARLLMSLVLLLVMQNTVWGQSTQLHTANGTFTVPSGVTGVTVEAWGGGGGGGAGGAFLSTGRGGGGAGGSFTRAFTVVPSASYTVTVGIGGPGGAGTTNGTAGGASSLGALVSAPGGSFGYYGGNTNGAGGAATTTGGTYYGGAGSTAASSSGAGGGGAGNNGNGGNASGATGGAAGAGLTGGTTGGVGAAGRNNNGIGNSATTLSGGGGGGFYSGFLGANDGGAGFRGQVIVYYYQIQSLSATTPICLGSSANVTITSTSLLTGVPYTVTYNLGAGNLTANFIASAGSGTFTVPSTALTTSGIKTVTIIQITNGTHSGGMGANNTLLVTVRPQFTTGTIANAGETICSNGNPGIIGNLNAASGGDGTITYKWQANGVDIASSNSATYDPPTGLTTTTTYTRWAKDNTCNTAFAQSTGTWTVTVRPNFTVGAISTTGETICSNGNPGIIGNLNAASGGDGTITYKWQANGVDIASSNSATYDPPTGLTTNTTYTRWAKDNTCNTAFAQSTGSWTVTVKPQPTLASVTINPTTVCEGGSGEIVIEGLLNGTNTLNYNYTINGSGNTTTAVLTATGGIATVPLPNLTAGSHNVKINSITVNGCTVNFTSNNEVSWTVNTPSTAPTSITGTTTICNGQSTNLSVSGGSLGAGASWKWYSGTCGGTLEGTGSSITVNPTTTTTYYVRAEGTCNNSTCASSAVTVLPENTVTAPPTLTFCATSVPSDITMIGSDLGSGASYQWQINTNADDLDNPYSYSDISGAISKDYNPGTVTASIGYRRNVTGTCPSSSNIVKFHVTPDILNTIVPSVTTSNCGSINEYNMGGIPSGGNNNNFTFQWQSSTDGIAFSNITNALAQQYSPGQINTPTYFHRIAYSGHCTSYSNVLFYNTNASPATPETITGNNVVCSPSSSESYSIGAVNGATSYTWSYSGTGVVITGTSANVTVNFASNATSGILSVVANNSCGTSATRSLTVTVNAFSSSPTTTGAQICIGSTATLSAAGALSGQVYKWYSAASGGTLLKTSSNNSDNTYVTPILGSTTNYWVSVSSGGTCESARTIVTATFPALSTDDQNLAGTNSWVGHVYDGTNQGVLYTGSFTNYYGSYTETEAFDQSYGGDNVCFNIISNLVARSILTATYSVRYRMNSTKKGLYVANLGSDDGNRLTVDGTLIVNDWNDHSFASRPGALMTLNGTSSLVYDFYENGGQNRIVFQNLIQVLANTLATNTTQSICLGSVGSEISGDVYGTLPAGISLSGTGYQWTYSTTPGRARTEISSATGATFTPNTTVAPFNVAGTYYVYRNAILSSANNVAPNPYVATNESNVATVTVNPINTVGAASSTPTLCINAALTNITHTTTGATGIGTPTGLPTGVSAVWSSNTITIRGIPTESGTFNYSIPLTGGCGTVNATGTITVSPASVGGSVTGGTNICSGSTSAVLTLAGHTGTVTRWESSVSPFSTWIPIVNTNSTYTSGALTQTTQFRAVVTSGICSFANSAATTVTVNPQPTLASITANPPTVCVGSSVVIAGEGLLNGTNTFNYTINGSGNATADLIATGGKATFPLPNNLPAGNYNVKINSITVNGCTANFTSNNEVSWTVVAQPVAPGITKSPTDATVCAGQTLTVTTTAGSGGTGTIADEYRYSTDNSSTWSAWSATVPSFAAVAGTNLVESRRTASGSGCTTSGTNQVSWIVDPATDPGTVTASSSQVCYSASTTLTLSGSVGAIQWQQSADGLNGWTNVTGGSGATSASYITPNLITKTYYRAVVTSGTCSSSFSNTVEVGIDTEKPIISNRPVNISVPVTDELCTAVVNWDPPTASDNCTLTSFVSNLSPGATIAVGTSTVTYTATDNSGNVETFSFTITVTDNTAPNITCPAGSTVFCVANAPSYSTYAEFTAALGSASDNCSLNTDSFTQLSDDLTGSTLTRTYQIADMAGNINSCSQVFTVSQPAVTISSLNTTNTCIGGTLSISSNSTGLNYQWQVSSDNGNSWSDTGTGIPSYSGPLAQQGDQYRLLVSETSDFTGAGCVSTSNTLTFKENTPPVFTIGMLSDQTVCTLNGATSTAVYNIGLNILNVIDNCTEFSNLVLSYSITGDNTESGTNLAEGRVFNLGTYTIDYSVTDQAGLVSTHSLNLIVKQSPSEITISHSVVSGAGTGNTPNQCGSYNYSVDGGITDPLYTYQWKVYAGGTATGTPISTFSGSALYQVTWSGDIAPGTYTIEAIKKAGNDCESIATLEITLQNSFDLQVQPAGQDCKGEVTETTPFTITWTVDKLCGTMNWGFTYYLFAQDINALPVNYLTVNDGTGSFTGITNASHVFNTVVINGNPYLQTVYTLFIVNTNDSNDTNDFNKFYLKGIPETSPISTD